MSSTTHTYDLSQGYNATYSDPNASTLLDDLSLVDRKKDMRQLIKLLNMAKSGQAKSVLLCGDEGVGKTALIDTFCTLIRKSMYCRIIDLRHVRLESAESLYVSIIDALQLEASAILDEALEAVNDINAELGIEWDRQDLVRSIALIKLQESIGGKDALTQDGLAKAIKSSIPTVKKLKFSTVNDNIERIVNIIVNPWLLVATNLINPLVPDLEDALRLAQQIKKGTFPSSASPLKKADNGNGKSETKPFDIEISVETETSEALEKPALDTRKILDPLDLGLKTHQQAGTSSLTQYVEASDLSFDAFDSPSAFSIENSRGQTPQTLSSRSFDNPVEQMTHHLVTLFNFINKAIGTLDSGLFMAIDNWEQIINLPEDQANEIKSFMTHFLREVVDRKKTHLMVALSCESAGQSEALGGSLYNLFRNKLLLTGINERARRKFFLKALREAGIQIEEPVLEEVFRLTRGNPFWLLKAQHYLQERAESNQVTELNLEFYRKLGIETRTDILESSFTHIELAYLNEEEGLYKVTSGLLKYFGQTPFNVQSAVTELSVSQNVSELFVAEVLRLLYVHNFLIKTTEAPETASTTPFYQIQSRPIFHYLSKKTGATQADISTEEKIAYLRKIIPLSIKSGELDREKTQEIIALSTTIGNDAMIPFLEETFLEYLKDEKPVVRITALNNLAVIDSEKAVTTILEALKDEDVTVREYAARNLSMLSKKTREPQSNDAIISALIQAIDDEGETVRAQVYATLARYKWHQDLSPVFLKGLADASESVRITSIQNLTELNTDTPLVRASYLDATDDSSPVVRRFACLGIQKYQDEESIEVLTDILRRDPEANIRALAANVISEMDTDLAFEALAKALQTDTDEDVRLMIVRSLAKRKGWRTEELLIETIENNPDIETHSPALLWVCIRTLGQVAGSKRSIELLKQVKKQVSHDIIEIAIDVATRKILERLEELYQMEKQLRSATPTTLVVSDADESPLLEDEEL